ncbi:MAG: hypothetical protein IJ789_06670 [Bacteroidales bacterium]|nr:hypothetical protein [Bacteroidales bacterium]
MKHFFPILIAAVICCCTSCSNNTIFSDERTFDNDDWRRFSKENFDVQIKDVESCYHLCFDMWIDTTRFREQLLQLAVNMESPTGDRRMFPAYVHIREHGRWQGEMEGNLLHVKDRLRQYFFFNSKGEQHIEIEQATNRYDLYGVNRIKFHIEKAELAYPK